MIDVDWTSVGMQVLTTTVAAYAGVSARLARVEERLVAAAARATEAVEIAGQTRQQLERHVEVFHTHQRANDRV